MLIVLWSALILCLKALGLAFLSYLFYWRVIDYAHSVWFYGNQDKETVVIMPGHLPLLGNLVQIAQSMWKSYKEGDNYFVLKHALDKSQTEESQAAVITFITDRPVIGISDPAIVAELYTTKNKYFDKHPLVKDIAYCLTGDSILFAETTQDWKDTRKALSPAFYKGKLEQLTEIAK